MSVTNEGRKQVGTRDWEFKRPENTTKEVTISNRKRETKRQWDQGGFVNQPEHRRRIARLWTPKGIFDIEGGRVGGGGGRVQLKGGK